MDQTWGLKPELGVKMDLKPTVSFPQMSKEGHIAQRGKSLEVSVIWPVFWRKRKKDMMLFTKGNTQNRGVGASSLRVCSLVS